MIITRDEKSKRFLKNSLIVIVAIILVFLLWIVLLKYQVEGEDITKMPFQIESILIGSTADGIKKESTEEYQWNLDLVQVNDIYIGITKNPNIEKTEMIKNIIIDSIKVDENPQVGTTHITKMTKTESGILTYDSEDLTQFNYEGASNTDLDNLTIANQGGYIGFRYLIKDIKEYNSNDDEIRYNGELLDKAGITLDQIKSKISFDLTIELESNIKYKTTITLELPTGNILEEGTSTQQITDMEKLIFKRI